MNMWCVVDMFPSYKHCNTDRVYEFDDTVLLKADGGIQKGCVCVCDSTRTQPTPSVSCAAETARTF